MKETPWSGENAYGENGKLKESETTIPKFAEDVMLTVRMWAVDHAIDIVLSGSIKTELADIENGKVDLAKTDIFELADEFVEYVVGETEEEEND